MQYQDIYDALHEYPFEPFQLQLSNGQTHVVRHHDFAWVTRRSVFVGLPSGEDDVPDRAIRCDLLHVVAMEPVNGSHSSPKRNTP